MANNNNVSGWIGWAYFAGILMVVRGIVQAVLGASEIGQKRVFFLLNNGVLTAHSYITWGWIDLVIGILLLAAGFSLLHGSYWARVVGIVFAAIGLISNLIFLPVYPVWSVIAGLIDVFILYALVVHGNEVERKV